MNKYYLNLIISSLVFGVLLVNLITGVVIKPEAMTPEAWTNLHVFISVVSGIWALVSLALYIIEIESWHQEMENPT